MSNHRARIWDHRGNKPLDLKFLLLGHHLDGFDLYILFINMGIGISLYLLRLILQVFKLTIIWASNVLKICYKTQMDNLPESYLLTINLCIFVCVIMFIINILNKAEWSMKKREEQREATCEAHWCVPHEYLANRTTRPETTTA
jgi:hypothetical protein